MNKIVFLTLIFFLNYLPAFSAWWKVENPKKEANIIISIIDLLEPITDYDEASEQISQIIVHTNEIRRTISMLNSSARISAGVYGGISSREIIANHLLDTAQLMQLSLKEKACISGKKKRTDCSVEEIKEYYLPTIEAITQQILNNETGLPACKNPKLVKW